MMKKISQKGIDLIKEFEGCRLVAYKPINSEAFYTIGYGRHSPDIKEGMTITQEQAEEMLVSDLIRYQAYVNNLNLQLNQNQFDSLVSFCYNTGSGNLQRLCLGKTVEQIGMDILLYVYAGGQLLNGLVRRRKAEYEMFMEKDVIKVSDDVVDFILAVMGDYWKRMDGNIDVQNYTHYVANELRKAVGRKEE